MLCKNAWNSSCRNLGSLNQDLKRWWWVMRGQRNRSKQRILKAGRLESVFSGEQLSACLNSFDSFRFHLIWNLNHLTHLNNLVHLCFCLLTNPRPSQEVLAFIIAGLERGGEQNRWPVTWGMWKAWGSGCAIGGVQTPGTHLSSGCWWFFLMTSNIL